MLTPAPTGAILPASKRTRSGARSAGAVVCTIVLSMTSACSGAALCRRRLGSHQIAHMAIAVGLIKFEYTLTRASKGAMCLSRGRRASDRIRGIYYGASSFKIARDQLEAPPRALVASLALASRRASRAAKNSPGGQAASVAEPSAQTAAVPSHCDMLPGRLCACSKAGFVSTLTWVTCHSELRAASILGRPVALKFVRKAFPRMGRLR
jgi:hypothetical protein